MPSPPDSRDLAPGASSGNLIWHFARAVFDERAMELRVAGQPVELERKPLELLRHLLRHAGEVVTREELLEAVWPGRIATEASLAKAVSRVRQELGDSDQTLIRTVHGYGYRLAAEVRIERPEAGLAAQAPRRFEFRPGMAIEGRPLWELREHLASGGQGDVWLAEQTRSGERRVLKFASDEAGLIALKREITLYRFLRETVGPAARCVRLIDWNLEIEPFFSESEHIAGGDLLAWAARQGGLPKVPLATRLELLAQAAEAVAAAHGVGVLHRDLKPANLLIAVGDDGSPSVRVADFGSGGLLEPGALDRLGITRLGLSQALASGSDTGTPFYRAPELLAGQLHTVRADVYALGVMLYQLTIGDGQRPLAAGWEADIDDPLIREDIALAAAGNPALRLADAGELVQRLRTLDDRRERRREQDARLIAGQRALIAAEQARQENEKLKARRFWLRASIAVLVIGLGSSIGLYLRSERALVQAQAATATAEAVTTFFTDDLLDTLNYDQQVDSKTLTVARLFDLMTGRVDQRLAGQPEVEVRVRQLLALILNFVDETNPLVATNVKAGLKRFFELAESQPLKALPLLTRMSEASSLAVIDAPERAALIAVLDRIQRDHRWESFDHRPLVTMRLALARNVGVIRGLPKEAIPILAALDQVPSLDPDERWKLQRLRAALLRSLGQPREALAQLRAAMNDPNARRYIGEDWEYDRAQAELGRLQLEFDQFQPAGEALDRFAAVVEKTLKPTHSTSLTVQCSRLLLRIAEGRYREALAIDAVEAPLIGTFVAGLTQGSGGSLIDCRSYAVDASLLAGAPAVALAASADAMALMDSWVRRFGPDDGSPSFFMIRLRHAEALIETGDPDKARAMLASLSPEALSNFGPDNAWSAERLRVEARLAQADGDTDRARSKLATAETMLLKVFGESSWRLRRVRAALAKLA